MKHSLIAIFVFFTLTAKADPTPVERFGALRVAGNKIVDKNGNPAQLRGVSLFWSQWMGKFYNADAVHWLVEDWNINIIRVAMAVDNNGYSTNRSEQDKVLRVIDAAIKEGIYVIVDFHVHDGHKYLKDAKEFFGMIAKRYARYPNIIYEPWNEPVHHSWSDVIKPYHEAVIATIREHDADNLIVCGTRTWSQNVEEASLDPIEGKNIAYTLHFYASTHKQELRNIAKQAMANGAALMVTEYGTCEASGNGFVDENEMEAWWKFMDDHSLSHCNWSLADKKESASILNPNAKAGGGWREADLTRSGKMVRDEILAKNK
ncbi:MAG TPA: glycoside hydrolase family 5 protein [Chryseosolibacter sp.]